MDNMINSIYLKHDTTIKSLTKRTLSQIIIKTLYFNGNNPLNTSEIISSIEKLLDIRFKVANIEEALKHLTKTKKIHPENNGYVLNSNTRTEVKQADARNKDLHKNVISYWFSESKTFKSENGENIICDWFTLILIEFFNIYKNEWMLDVASEQKRSKKKFEFESLFKIAFSKVRVDPNDIEWLKERFFEFFESSRIEDNEIFWNYGTSAFASTLITARYYADKGADMNQAERDQVIERFKTGQTKYIVATDAAAEGLNLQNCCIMFNYDLHWNPMKIEQRIGRIHRFKQDRDVTIFNLAVKDTIDDYVLHVLYQKIDLFTMTVGKMETVLAELKEGSQDIQKTIGEILLRSHSRLDMKKELEKLGNDLAVSRKNEELAEQFTRGVLD
jgi:hypothetical protein